MYPKIFEITGVININNCQTNVTMILDDDSAGHSLKSELIDKFSWVEIEESKPFRYLNIEKW